MLQKDYNVKGWLGLLLGTRLYHVFYDAEDLDEPAFERRVDAVARELGDRGKAKPDTTLGGGAPTAEGAAPASPPSAPAPAPAPAAPATTPTPTQTAFPATPSPYGALAPTVALDHNFSPSMRMASPAAGAASPGGLAELAALFKEMRQDARLERDEMEAKVEKMHQLAEHRIQKQRVELAPAPSEDVVSGEQLTALQARLEALRAAQLCPRPPGG